MTPQTNDTTATRDKEIYRVTLAGSIVNLLLLLAKFIAGLLGNSAAMIADAVHSLSDFISDIVVIALVRISGKPHDKNHEYGHGKYETLATIIIGLILLSVGSGLLVNGLSAVRAFIGGNALPQPGTVALAAAVASISAKEMLFRYTVRRGRQLDSPAVVANAWHHRSDALSSVATAAGIGGAILMGDNWLVLDPLAAILVSLLIVRMAVKLTIPGLQELLEKSLPDEEEERIVDIIESFPDVSRPHNLRTRRIGSNYSIEVHVLMPGDMTVNQSHEITRKIENRLKSQFGKGTFINIHVEPDTPGGTRQAT